MYTQLKRFVTLIPVGLLLSAEVKAPETKILPTEQVAQAQVFQLRQQNLLLQQQLLTEEQNGWLLKVCEAAKFAKCTVDLQNNLIVEVTEKK